MSRMSAMEIRPSQTGAIHEANQTDASRSGDVDFSNSELQSIGRMSSPNACNFSSARLAYARTLPASSTFSRMSWLRPKRVCKMFPARITKALSRSSEVEDSNACRKNPSSGAWAEQAEDAGSTNIILCPKYESPSLLSCVEGAYLQVHRFLEDTSYCSNATFICRFENGPV